MSNGARWVGVVVFFGFVGTVGWLARGSMLEDERRRDAQQRALHKAEAERRARRAPKPTLPLTQDELLKAIATAAGTDTSRITVDDYTPASIAMTYEFPAGDRPSEGQVHVELTATVGAAVKALMAAGWNPREREMVIAGRARQPGDKSITGQKTVRRLGRATYTWYEDRVAFEPEN